MNTSEKERMQRAIDWCLKHGVRRAEAGGLYRGVPNSPDGQEGYGYFEKIAVPSEFSDLIK